MKKYIFTLCFTLICSNSGFADRVPEVNCLHVTHRTNSQQFRNFNDLLEDLFDGFGTRFQCAIERLDKQLNLLMEIYPGDDVFLEEIKYIECWHNSNYDDPKFYITIHLYNDFEGETSWRIGCSNTIYEKVCEAINRFFLGTIDKKDLNVVVKGRGRNNKEEKVLVKWADGEVAYAEPFFN